MLKQTMKSKKGFTLVELSIVIMIIAIIVGMATTFLGHFNQDALTLTKQKTSMNDVSNLRQAVKTWILNYDNTNYTISTSNSQLIATPKIGGDKYYISFNEMDNKMKYYKESTLQKDIEFDSIKKISFSSDGNIITCRVDYTGGTETMLFAVLSQTERTRYSPVDR